MPNGTNQGSLVYAQSPNQSSSSRRGAPEPTKTGADMSDGSLTVGTDGACLGNPGPAGWAWVDEHGNYHSSGQAAGSW